MSSVRKKGNVLFKKLFGCLRANAAVHFLFHAMVLRQNVRRKMKNIFVVLEEKERKKEFAQ